jgi:hypothetical protein
MQQWDTFDARTNHAAIAAQRAAQSEHGGLTKQKIISELSRSTHGALTDYVPVAREAAKQEPEFLAHLIAWNERNGQVRDSKVALPVASLIPGFEYAENSLAHLALLDPRTLVRAMDFAKTQAPGFQRQLKAVTERYLRVRESSYGRWERTAIQHRNSLKTLYAKNHIKPVAFADAILFKGKRTPGSVFEAIATLKDMPAMQAAGTIIEKRIPFLVAVSALGKRMKETELVMALIDLMSPTELVTNTKMLERMGVKDVPALRAAYEAGLQRVAESKKATLKTTRAAEAQTDEKLKSKLVAAQEKQIKAMGGPEGNWVVLADKSSSMTEAIEVSRLVSATLAAMVKGDVYLIFFDSGPRFVNVTGKTYDQIKTETSMVKANGSTSIGCGLNYALANSFDVSGIAIVSDGAENTPPAFVDVYQRLCKTLERDIPVYLYWTKCHQPNTYDNNPEALAQNMARANLEMQVFDLRTGTDYYALPNLVQTMKANRYSLVDAIFETPLLTLDEVFDVQKAA